MTQRIAFAALVIAFAGLLVLVPGRAQEPAAEADSAPDTVRIAFFEQEGIETATLDPHAARDPLSFRLISTVHETLYMWTPGDEPQVVPCLAADWPEFSEDGLTATIRLRDDVQYHNSHIFGDDKTRKLNAEDVIDNLKRLAVYGDDGMYWMADGLIEGLNDYGRNARYDLEYGTTDTEVPGLKAVDEHTLEIRLTRRFAPLVTLLAHPSFSIIPGEAMDTWGGQLYERAVGTGRYRLNAISDGRVYVFKAFDGYWGEKPAYDRVTFGGRNYWNEFAAGFREGDYAETPIWQAYWDDVVDDGKLTGELEGAGGEPVKLNEHGYYYLCFNMDDDVWGALDDDGRALRKAVSLAFDREGLIERLGNEWLGAQEALFPTGMEFEERGAGDYGAHDLDRAKQVLDGSKYKGGKHPDTGEPVELDFACIQAPFYVEMAEELEEALDALGMTLNVRYLDGDDYRDVILDADDDMFSAGWFLDYPDAQNFLQLFWSERAAVDKEFNNAPRYRSDEYDEAYLELERILPTPENREQRNELVAKMAEILEKDRPTLALIHNVTARLRSSNVEWPQMPRQTFNDVIFLKPAEEDPTPEGEEAPPDEAEGGQENGEDDGGDE